MKRLLGEGIKKIVYYCPDCESELNVWDGSTLPISGNCPMCEESLHIKEILFNDEDAEEVKVKNE